VLACIAVVVLAAAGSAAGRVLPMDDLLIHNG
jgi:hypothetical protein